MAKLLPLPVVDEPRILIERWKWIPGYEGRYQVSTAGRVRSFVKLTPIIMKQTIHLISGYVSVSLYQGNGGRVRKQICVHWAVMRAFVGPCPEGYEVRHLNGNPNDARLSNLCYGTKRENADDKRRHGTHMQGEEVNGAVLTEFEVAIIKRALDHKVKARALADQFDVHEQTIYAIKAGRSWNHVRAAA